MSAGLPTLFAVGLLLTFAAAGPVYGQCPDGAPPPCRGAEILRTEQAMLEHGMVPSVFFRFPGLVSSRELFDRVVAHGLVPVGSDAWLAKGQGPAEGSIVLVHGNGNEPIGIEDFLRLLRTERANIRDRDWLLVDLRQSAVPQGTDRQQPPP
jgi:hypothetical protein